MRHTPACLQYHERLSLPFLISCFLSAASMAAKSAPSSCGPFFLALFAARRAACASALPSSSSSPSASLPAKEAKVDLCWPKVSRGLETMWTHSSPASTAGLDTPALEIAWLLAIYLNQFIWESGHQTVAAYPRCCPHSAAGQRRGGCGPQISAAVAPGAWDPAHSAGPAACAIMPLT